MIVITVARKPVEGTVSSNVLEHGTGALNIDASRVESEETLTGGGGKLWSHYRDGTHDRAAKPEATQGKGRWPANVILSEEAAKDLDRQSGSSTSPKSYVRSADGKSSGRSLGGTVGQTAGTLSLSYGDTGGASRYFKVVKERRRGR